MSIFADKQEAARQAENVVNRLHRHCRIGRVRRKMQILGGKWVLPPWDYPTPNSPQPQKVWSGGYVHVTSSGDVPVVPYSSVI